MGVHSFQKYQENRGGLIKNVDMIRCINDWKSSHRGQTPVIIVHLRELIVTVVQANVRDAAFGGRHHVYYRQLDDFFQRLRALGVKLVFFGGPTKRTNPFTDAKVARCCSSNQTYYENSTEILKLIDDNAFEAIEPKVNFFRSLFGLYVKGIADKYGEHWSRNVGQRFTQAMVAHARREQAIAILAKDNDFMLYDLGNTQYWNCGRGHLDMQQFTVTAFDQVNAIGRMQLTSVQYFTTVAVLSTIYKDDATRQQFGMRNLPLIDHVANGMRHQPSTRGLQAIAELFFGERAANYAPLIEMELHDFTKLAGDNVPAEPVLEGDMGVVQSKLTENHALYCMWTDSITNMNMQLIDLNQWNAAEAKSYPELFVAVHRRGMGVLLNGNRGEEIRRWFVFKKSPTEISVVHESLEFPPPELHVPNIMDVLGKSEGDTDNSAEAAHDKWTTFLWVIDVKPNPVLIENVLRVPRSILPALVTAMFLRKEHQITDTEAYALIRSEYEVIRNQNDSPIEYPATNRRTIRVAHVYVHARVFINRMFMICGLDLCKVPVMFDGVAFHSLMDDVPKAESVIDFETGPFRFSDVLDYFQSTF